MSRTLSFVLQGFNRIFLKRTILELPITLLYLSSFPLLVMIGSCKAHYFANTFHNQERSVLILNYPPLGIWMLWWLCVEIPSTPVTLWKNLSYPAKLLVPLETDSKYVIFQGHSTIGGYIWNKNGTSL